MSSFDLSVLELLLTEVTAAAAAALGDRVAVAASPDVPVAPSSPPSPYGLAMQPPEPSAVMSDGQTQSLVLASLIIGATHFEVLATAVAAAPP